MHFIYNSFNEHLDIYFNFCLIYFLLIYLFRPILFILCLIEPPSTFKKKTKN